MALGFRTLHGRLAGGLLLLLGVLGALHLASTLITTRLYQREVTHGLQKDLAANIAGMKHERLVTADGEPREEGVRELFHWLMVVNPTLELYLLDRDGRILAYDAQPGVVQRETVDLEPVRRFLADGSAPVLGDDPRHPERRKLISVAPLPAPDGGSRGYLYTVLAGQLVDSARGWFWGRPHSYLRAASALVSLLLAAAAGFLLFRSLTRPLRGLAAAMDRFQSEEGRTEAGPRPGAVGGEAGAGEGDEVARLRSAFGALRERIRRQVAEIERLADQRRELIANVSHDLRTPIASVQGYLETLVLKEETLGPAERSEYLHIALRQSQRLATLVDELFELTKLDAHEVEARMELFALAELVQDNVQRFRLQAEGKGVRIEASLNADLPPVRADLGLIERALENLIENAVRFTPAGGAVTVEVASRRDRVEVAVKDTGCGIEAHELPHIFDRFYRCQFNAADPGEGAGLGLAITRRIVELHDSEIHVSSAPGAGTTFRFSLPAETPRAA